MKRFIAGVLFTLILFAVTVFAVASFGLYPIGADNPPGGLERALAAKAMDVYAEKHKPAVDNPTAITAENLIEGAKEYEEHCAFCHGGAKAKISPMENKFNPPAPQLINRIPHDPDNWLFWVTKHGVRMTGMPSWDGVMSDEEMWKVVAFIKHSDKLPPEAAAAWQKLASTPGEIEEHTPEQHKGGESAPHSHGPGQ
jgi:mono/diheme cytochrome c family protein